MKFKVLWFSLIILMIVASCNNPQVDWRNHTECILLDSVEKLYNCELYDSLGNIRRTGKYLDDKAVGTHKFYKNGKLDYIREYVLLENMKNFLNQIYKIDLNGDTVLSSSAFVRVNAPKNVQLHDSIIIEYEVVSSLFKNSQLQAFFELENDSENVRLGFGEENKILYGIVCNKIGITYIKCRIDELEIDDSKPSLDSLHNVKSYYIEYSINVSNN